MKVYIPFEYSHIEQEDSSSKILGVFSSEEKASERMKKEAHFLMETHTENYPFIWEDKYICGCSGHTYFDYAIQEFEVDKQI